MKKAFLGLVFLSSLGLESAMAMKEYSSGSEPAEKMDLHFQSLQLLNFGSLPEMFERFHLQPFSFESLMGINANQKIPLRKLTESEMKAEIQQNLLIAVFFRPDLMPMVNGFLPKNVTIEELPFFVKFLYSLIISEKII